MKVRDGGTQVNLNIGDRISTVAGLESIVLDMDMNQQLYLHINNTPTYLPTDERVVSNSCLNLFVVLFEVFLSDFCQIV